jgi:hypothetical protein
MVDWKISESIANGIEKGLDKISDKLIDSIMDGLCKIFSSLLDGASVLIIIAIMYFAFRYMTTIKSDKQEDNVNTLVSLGGLYFIVKMFAVFLN